MAGKVYLVGAGPGDEKLITVKALEKLKEADAVIYDRLANPSLLKYCKKECEQIDVGKIPGNHSFTQDQINDVIVKKSQEEKMVVRLKGGDPYVFGRGGEEAKVLYDLGIDFEVVPGVTSAIGGLAYAGIPITHREYASSFHVITGHLKSEEKELDWASLANVKGTLVFLMGVKNIKKICEELIKNGKQDQTPVAIIHRASTPWQKVITGTLSSIVTLAEKEQIKSPSLIVVGDVVGLRKELNFFEKKPLFGKNIVITRARAQNSTLLQKISELGANAIEMPTIRIQPLNEEPLKERIEKIDQYQYLIFTSKNGVDLFFECLFASKKDARALNHLQIIAIGNGTAAGLGAYGITADYIPDDFVGEGIVDVLREKVTQEDTILLPRSKNARPYLVDTLSQLCAVDEVCIYEAVKEEMNVEGIVEMFKNGEIDYITFTSSSTVENFMEMMGMQNKELFQSAKIISIGPITSKKIREMGLSVYQEALQYNIQGVIDEILENRGGK